MARFGLAGRTALVTGAALRLGKAIALELARAGANLVVHYHRSGAEAEAACAEIAALGVKAWALQADLSSPDQAAGLVGRATELAGPVEVLVNSASIFGPSTIADVSFDQVVEYASVNAWAPFALSREFARQTIDAGRIVNLLDTRVQAFDLQHVAYILSKHALLQFTRMTAMQFAPRITVNAVAPGLILPPPGEDESYLGALAERLPLRRHGEAQDIADAVRFLVEASFITGQVLFVDGGRHLREL
ncbi:MAG: SDR family oxidoreductase [Armatimonadota bacterium]